MRLCDCMNILISTTTYPPDIGGPATYAKEINERLTKKGHSVIILTTSSSNDDNIISIPKKVNFRIVGFIFNQLQIIFCFFRFRNKFDLIYTLDPAFLGLTSIFCGNILRKPTILRFGGDIVWENAFNHDLTNETPEYYYKNIKLFSYTRFIFYLQKVVMKLSKKIIVPSKSIKNIIMNFYHIESKQIKVINSSVDVNIENFNKHFRKGKLTIISVGRLIKLKRIDIVIKMIYELSEYPELELLIAGDGPEKENLQQLINKMGVQNRIKILGNLNRHEINDLYRNSEILILNSIYEVFPHVLIEAMANHVIVITSSCGGSLEIVNNGINGLIVESGDIEELKMKLLLLIKNNKIRVRIMKNAYQSVSENFNWEKNLNLLIIEFEGVL